MVAAIVLLLGVYVWHERTLVNEPAILAAPLLPPVASLTPPTASPAIAPAAPPPASLTGPPPPPPSVPSAALPAAVPAPAATAPLFSAPAGSVPPAAPPSTATEPSFDVVRVGPSGSVVIAGRAAPGTEIVVRDGGTEIARVQTDRQGTFVATPSAPLAPGGRELTLASRVTGSAEETQGQGAVMLDIPRREPNAPSPNAPSPIAVLVAPNASPRVLQGPATDTRFTGPKLDTVDYNEAGSIRFSGAAPPGSLLRVYVDNAPVVEGRAGAEGRWALVPTADVAPGIHTVRVDVLGNDGKVASRIELPFQRATLPAAEIAGLAPGRVVVQPGQTLWRLARNAYGHGVQYTVLYLANRDQIRDANRIYPGQTFTIPSP